MLTVGSLFAGIGGFDLGLERAGMRVKWQCEKDPWARKVLAKHWPGVPCYEDITTLEPQAVEYVDVLAGGFPCQPFSTASHGRITATDLWPEMARIVSGIKPKWVVVENVARKPIETAQAFLISIGYATAKKNIGAYEIGADHKRNRWWLLAHANDQGKLSGFFNEEVAVMQEVSSCFWGWESFARAGRVSNGVSHRVDRLRGLGNAVVPQVVEWLGRMILTVEANDD